MAGSETRLRRSRADFERNRSEILESAEKRFSKEGVGTSLEAVARDAGVGSATLYRHFPTRDALLAELLSRRESQLLSEKHRIEQIVDSGSALEQWMAALEDFFGAFEGLPGPLRSAFLEEHNPLAVSCTGFIDLTGQFLGAAQRDGKAHSWLRARDLFLAALALSWVRGSSLADESSQQHLRALSRDGYASTNEAP
ncbi:TetR/AcrR family transcriptional regulator [Rhodococcus koreensis]|uniref:TetR/AcrR family transcriptional regulator n=1 Tax=Rhodococcus koreensis TaxID=99653 RepID=UPI00197F286F|nr:TetR/AcrR family transcriptional regulator [Rhodococcus koreensis]QSE85854.1 TetR/AcrR family transcriptional regulator [Rhodococcus koreensis]